MENPLPLPLSLYRATTLLAVAIAILVSGCSKPREETRIDKARQPLVRDVRYASTGGDVTNFIEFQWAVGRCIRAKEAMLIRKGTHGHGSLREIPTTFPIVEGLLVVWRNPVELEPGSIAEFLAQNTEYLAVVMPGTEFAINQVFFLDHWLEGPEWHLVAPIELHDGRTLHADLFLMKGSAVYAGDDPGGPVAAMREGDSFLRDEEIEWCEPLDLDSLPLPEEP